MNADEFRDILQGAITGNHRDLEAILELYKDLKQYILIHIALNISKFKI